MHARTAVQAIRYHDALAAGKKPPPTGAVCEVPRKALVQVYCFLEIVGQHIFAKMKNWKEHERFRVDWKDKASLSRFMRSKYQVRTTTTRKAYVLHAE